jgi:hypothetical protein
MYLYRRGAGMFKAAQLHPVIVYSACLFLALVWLACIFAAAEYWIFAGSLLLISLLVLY